MNTDSRQMIEAMASGAFVGKAIETPALSLVEFYTRMVGDQIGLGNFVLGGGSSKLPVVGQLKTIR